MSSTSLDDRSSAIAILPAPILRVARSPPRRTKRRMRTHVVLSAVLGTCLLGGGCVTRARYDELQRSLDDATAALVEEQAERDQDRRSSEQARAAADQRTIDLAKALELEETRADACGRQITSLQAMLDAKGQELAELDHALTDSKRELADVVRRRMAIKESLAQMTQALTDLAARKLAAERRISEYRDMLTRFSKLIDAGTLSVRIVDGRMVLTLPMDILFASGRTDLTPDGRAALREVGAGLATIPDRQFQVEGHTDTVPIRTARFPSNWELGAGRALVVLHTLREAGVGATQLTAATHGEHHPRADNGSEEGRAANRRIEIVVVPDLSELPGYAELNELAQE